MAAFFFPNTRSSLFVCSALCLTLCKLDYKQTLATFVLTHFCFWPIAQQRVLFIVSLRLEFAFIAFFISLC